MIRTHEEHLAHYGILRKSGRYPWGSGGTENARNRSFLDIVDKHKKEGMSDTDIAKMYGISRNQLTAARTIAIAQQKQQKIITAQRYKDRGWSNSAIGRRMGINESSVRSLLAPGAADKAQALNSTADFIKSSVDKKGMVQIGSGVEHQLGITKTRLNAAVAVLKEQGYEVHNIYVPQVGQKGQWTNVKVLAKPGTTKADVDRNRSQIDLISGYSPDHGRTYQKFQTPISIDSKRIDIKYKEDGGDQADGLIYVRPGVKDLTIGANRYGQVRIAVDGTHYLKGMAVYKDDLPPGVDLVFNTNKSNTGNKKDAMKPMNLDDPDNPFGAIVRQRHGPDGKVISAINLVGSPSKEGSGEEGSWDTFSRNLPSQVLSKQSPELAKQQLKLTQERRIREFNEINSLTNPTVRKELLLKFADETDSAAVHLKAASLPRQATKVLIPIPSMKSTEVYAPTMRDGEKVALVRFPHGGTFEIPILTVNNRNREGRKILGTGSNSRHDAIGINHKVAQRLSGADFDGDFVLVIPNNKGAIKNTPALEGLKDFDPLMYKIPEGSPIPRVTNAQKQPEMGKVSNLITDMTLKGANSEQLARAIRHSMVVIDSEKHGLDIKASERDNGILALKQEYQGGKRAGAKTLISRAGADLRIDERRPRPESRGGPIDRRTGKKVFEPTGRTFPETKRVRDPDGKIRYVPTGRTKPKQIVVEKLAATDDAFTLIDKPGTRMETIYAEHSNTLKAMANTARKEAVSIKGIPYSPSARKVYANEVESLVSKINLAERNAPLEKQAQLIANTIVAQKRQANPGMDKDDLKKVKTLALNEARIRTGANKTRITPSQAEWNAIQAGALSTDRLNKVLKNSNIDEIKRLAMPRNQPKMTSTKITRARAMQEQGYTQIEIADALGVGLTTLKLSLGE